MSSSPLLSLPPELLIAVLRNLPLSDVHRCERVCTALRTLIKASSDLQYAIALEAECYDDVPCSASLAEKLDHLRRGKAAWSRQKTRFIKDIEVKHNVSGIYDLAGGIYLLGDISKHSMYWLRLPQQEDDEVKWNSFRVPESIIDIGLAIDEHDLCAVVTTSTIIASGRTQHEISMYFYQLSTGQPHPDAAQHRLVVHRSDIMSRPAIGIEIVGDNLVLIFSDYRNRHQPDDRLYVYEWKSAKLKMSLVAPYRTYSGPLFLTEELVMLPNAKEGTLEVWKIPRKVNLPSPSAPFVALQLPTLAPGRQYVAISCRGEPNPVGDHSKLASRIRDRFYQARARDAIMIFNVNVEPSQNPFNIALGHQYTFFIHRKSFIEAVEEADKRRHLTSQDETIPSGARFKASNDIDIPFPSATAVTITVPWQNWGPPVTRWLEAERFPTRWITTTAGQRAILTNLPTAGGTNLLVFDFNPYHIKRTAWELKEKKLRAAEAMVEEEGRCLGKGKERMVQSQDREEPVVGDQLEPAPLSGAPPEPGSPSSQKKSQEGTAPAVASQDQGPSTVDGAPGTFASTSSGSVSPTSQMPGSFTLGSSEPNTSAQILITDIDMDDAEDLDLADLANGDDGDDMEYELVDVDDEGVDDEDAEDEDADDGEEDDDSQPMLINITNFPHLPADIIPFLIGHPNGLTLAQHINDLQEAHIAGNDSGEAGLLGHLGGVVGEGNEMPGAWSESQRASDDEESDEEGQHTLRTSIVWQRTQVDKFGRSFESPVVSHLPFVQVMTWIDQRYEGVLMDEERLLGISTDDRDIEKVDVLYLG